MKKRICENEWILCAGRTRYVHVHILLVLQNLVLLYVCVLIVFRFIDIPCSQ